VPEPTKKIDCRKAHELLSRQLDASLDPAEKSRLALHLAICDFCVRVERQFLALREAIRRLGR